MHETIFNQKQVLQGTVFIIYSYCKYNKLYVRLILWSLNHYFKLLQFLDIQGSILDSNIYMP